MHTEKDLREWFEKIYRPVLEATGIKSEKFIYNMDEKECWIPCPIGEEVVVLIRITEIYIRIPKNQLSLTIVKSISVDRKAISPLIIVPSSNIMAS